MTSNTTESYDPMAHMINYLKAHGYVACAICVCGILGNIATIIVLSRPKMASSPVNFLLTMVAVAQLLLMLVYLPQAIILYVLWDHHSNLHPTILGSWSEATFHQFAVSFTVFCHSTAIWHVIAVAMFRWLTLGIPHGRHYCTRRNAYICSAVLVAMNALLSVPNWITNRVESEKDGLQVHWQVQVRSDIKFNRALFALVALVLPCILLTVLTIMLIVIMSRAMRRRQTLLSKGHNEESNRQREHNRTTGMLLAVVALFLIIELPHGIFLIMMEINPDLQGAYLLLGEIIDTSTLIAFSINFILYTAMSRQFRTTFIALFCKKPTEVQSNNMRRLSTMVTSVKLTVTPKRSTALSQSSNTSMQYNNNEGGENSLSLTTPLMTDQRQHDQVNSVTSASINTDETYAA